MAGSRVGVIRQGDIVRVLEGPVTANSYNWFRVETDSGDSGWAAESNCEYWLSPHDGPAATSTPTPVGDVNLNFQGICEIADAIRAANTDSAVGDCPPGGGGRDRITLLKNIALSGALPRITSTIDVVGNGNSISGGGAHRIFTVSEGGELEVIQLRLINGSASDGGAIFNNGGRFVSTSSHFIGNSASRHGGAIYSDAGSVLIWSESTFSNNSAEEDGGAIYSNDRDGSLTVQGSTFSGNTADDGGAVSSYRSALTIEFSTFSSNTARRNGGAVLQRGNMDLHGNEFRNNAARDGGAVHWRDGEAAVTENTFSGNDAGDDGGAYFQDYGGPAYVERNTFRNNDADDDGGALYFDGGEGWIQGNSYSGNSPNDCYARDDAVVTGECGEDVVAPQVVEVTPTAAVAEQQVVEPPSRTYSTIANDVLSPGSQFDEYPFELTGETNFVTIRMTAIRPGNVVPGLDLWGGGVKQAFDANTNEGAVAQIVDKELPAGAYSVSAYSVRGWGAYRLQMTITEIGEAIEPVAQQIEETEEILPVPSDPVQVDDVNVTLSVEDILSDFSLSDIDFSRNVIPQFDVIPTYGGDASFCFETGDAAHEYEFSIVQRASVTITASVSEQDSGDVALGLTLRASDGRVVRAETNLREQEVALLSNVLLSPATYTISVSGVSGEGCYTLDTQISFELDPNEFRATSSNTYSTTVHDIEIVTSMETVEGTYTRDQDVILSRLGVTSFSDYLDLRSGVVLEMFEYADNQAPISTCYPGDVTNELIFIGRLEDGSFDEPKIPFVVYNRLTDRTCAISSGPGQLLRMSLSHDEREALKNLRNPLIATSPAYVVADFFDDDVIRLNNALWTYILGNPEEAGATTVAAATVCLPAHSTLVGGVICHIGAHVLIHAGTHFILEHAFGDLSGVYSACVQDALLQGSQTYVPSPGCEGILESVITGVGPDPANDGADPITHVDIPLVRTQ